MLLMIKEKVQRGKNKGAESLSNQKSFISPARSLSLAEVLNDKNKTQQIRQQTNKNCYRNHTSATAFIVCGKFSTDLCDP